MEIDRRAFLATLGGAAAIEAMPSEALADALEHHMMETLDAAVGGEASAALAEPEPIIRRGAGSIFGGGGPSGGAPTPVKKLEPMPDKPTLVDFFKLRFAP